MEDPKDALRRWRKAQGYSQAKLADLVGCHFSYIGHIERGVRSPDRRTANALQELTGIATAAWDAAEDQERDRVAS